MVDDGDLCVWRKLVQDICRDGVKIGIILRIGAKREHALAAQLLKLGAVGKGVIQLASRVARYADDRIAAHIDIHVPAE